MNYVKSKKHVDESAILKQLHPFLPFSGSTIDQKNKLLPWDSRQESLHLHSVKKGRVAEWLGRGLQNLLQRFESALDLTLCIL